MIEQKHRFHGRASITSVYRRGNAVRSDGLTLRYSDSRRQDYRLAVVVSKKVSKLAVVRNRIRRRIYEAVRKEQLAGKTIGQYDLVFSVFDERFAEMPAEELHGTIAKALKKASLLAS